MVPETIVLAAVAYYVGEHIDLTAAEPKRIVPSTDKAPSRALLPMAILTLGVIADVAMIAPSLQDFDNDEPLRLIDYVCQDGNVAALSRCLRVP